MRQPVYLTVIREVQPGPEPNQSLYHLLQCHAFGQVGLFSQPVQERVELKPLYPQGREYFERGRTAEAGTHEYAQVEQFPAPEREIELFGKQEESVDEFLQDEILPEERGDLGRIAIGQRNLKGGQVV